MVACLADIEDGIEISSLTAGGKHGPYSTLEGGNLSSYSIVGGVLQAGVEVTFFLEVEQLSHLVGVIVLEGG